MLWYKSWLDTRWRFSIGLALLAVVACGVVFEYVQVQKLIATVNPSAFDPGTRLGQALDEAIEVERNYRGFVWDTWFRQELMSLGAVFAALLGSGSPFSSAGRGLLFTLALPASRGRWLGARAATSLTQLLALFVLPSLAICALSPLVGEYFGAGDALVHAVCAFVVAAVFFSLALALSTVFDDLWRPLLLTCALIVVLTIAEVMTPRGSPFGSVLSAEAYFRGGSLPWVGLLISAGLSAALLYAAKANVARRDF